MGDGGTEFIQTHPLLLNTRVPDRDADFRRAQRVRKSDVSAEPTVVVLRDAPLRGYGCFVSERQRARSLHCSARVYPGDRHGDDQV